MLKTVVYVGFELAIFSLQTEWLLKYIYLSSPDLAGVSHKKWSIYWQRTGRVSNCFNIDNFCGKILYKYMGFKEGAPAFMTIEMMLDLFFLCSFVKVFFRSGVCFVL